MALAGESVALLDLPAFAARLPRRLDQCQFGLVQVDPEPTERLNFWLEKFTITVLLD
jgi:hypothetical protein